MEANSKYTTEKGIGSVENTNEIENSFFTLINVDAIRPNDHRILILAIDACTHRNQVRPWKQRQPSRLPHGFAYQRALRPNLRQHDASDLGLCHRALHRRLLRP